MSFIKLENVSYEYERYGDDDEVVQVTRALNNVSVDIEEGEFVAVVGHNGSGKSTFARILNGLIIPTAGRAMIADMDTAEEDKTWSVRRNAGMVFQNPDNQIIATVVEEDVAFGPENLGVNSEKIRARVAEALKVVGMSEYAKDSPGKLSGGQKQRVAIAGALAMHPRCLILDEATAMLDPASRREVMSTVRRLNKKEKLTVIFITHYMEEAITADRVLVMNKGEIAMDDTPRNIFGSEETISKYGLELPPVIELAASLRQAGINIPEGILTEDELIEALTAK